MRNQEFEEIYSLYFKDVYVFVLAMSKEAHLAEEITQETFFKALKGIKNFNGNCSIRVWLCQIAKNTYLSHLRKKQHSSLEGIEEKSDNVNIESEFINKETTISIYKILHGLPEPYKEVFSLRTLGELSFKEIGEVFEKKEGWARVTYHRARLMLSELLTAAKKEEI